MISILTYNILSPTLVDCFDATEESKNADNRLKRIKRKLQAYLNDKTIICLQEVGQQWIGPLKVFFKSYNYDSVMAQYGNHWNDYMGVMLCWPNTMELNDLKLEKPNSYIIPTEQDDNRFWIMKKLFPMTEEDNIWKKIRNKYNTIIIARFIIDNKYIINVATYHMPCHFDDSEQMNLFTMTALRSIEKHVNYDEPIVFAGDFNIQPDSTQYALITGQKSWKKEVSFEIIKNKNWYIPKRFYRSAYAMYFEKEPSGTNFCKRNHRGKSFSGCLDYIFFRNCKLIKAMNITQEFYIMKNQEKDLSVEPSDHLPLKADFVFQK